MTNEIFDPLTVAVDTALKMENPLAQSMLLAEIAQEYFRQKNVDQALTTAEKISLRTRKRDTLQDFCTKTILSGMLEPLPRFLAALLHADPESAMMVGRTATSLLKSTANKSGARKVAMAILKLTDRPFESEQAKYEFLEQLLSDGDLAEEADARRILDTIIDVTYADWGKLAFVIALAKRGNIQEAEKMALELTNPWRQSWAFFEMARTIEKNAWPRDQILPLYTRAEEILYRIVFVANEPQNLPAHTEQEALAIQSRILGKTVFLSGFTALGEKILERAEAATAKIESTLERMTQQYFLARTLKKLGLILAVGDYMNENEMTRADVSSLDKSRLLQYAAEAYDLESKALGLEYWHRAVTVVTDHDDAPDVFQDREFRQAERVTEMIRRLSFQKEPRGPTGDPVRDKEILPGEEFQDEYYSPFAIVDCDC